LQRNAFGQAARAHPGRFQRLDQGQSCLHLGQRHAQILGQFAQGQGQIARLVQLIDQEAGDETDAAGLLPRQT
jgi:hypothetical protein